GFANFFSGCTTHDNLPGSFLTDEADIFHSGFGAIARAADGTHFYFCWGEEMLEASFQFDAGFCGVLHAEAAEIGADAGLHHANAFGISLAARHAEVGPNFGEIRFFYAEKIDALTAGHFDHRHVVFFGDVGDAAKLFGGGDAAAHARHNG